MGVIQSDLNFYGSADMPDGDGTTTGGAVDFSTRVFFTDIHSATSTVDYMNVSATGSVTVTVYGLNSSGSFVSESKTINGGGFLNGTQVFSHILKATLTGTRTASVGVLGHNLLIAAHTPTGYANSTSTTPAYLLLQSGDGALCSIGDVISYNGSPKYSKRIIGLSGDTAYVDSDWASSPLVSSYNVSTGMVFDFSPNPVTQIRRPFYNAAADSPGGSTRTYYEKIFAVNNNATFALSNAIIQKTTDPAGAASYQFALTNSLNDTGTVTNRQTAPTSGITGWTSGSAPQSISVPSPGILPAGAAPNAAGAQGVWLSMALNPGTSSSFTATNMTMDGSSL